MKKKFQRWLISILLSKYKFDFHKTLIHSIDASFLSLTSLVNMKIHHILTHSIDASPLSLTSSINTKVHYVSSHSNLQNRRLSTLSTIIERSNINAIFSISLSNESLSSFMMNILRASEIAKLLKTYPNQCFVDIFMFIVISSAQINFQNDLVHRTQHSNHFSAFNHSKIINKSIQINLQKKWIIQISNLSFNYFYSPINLTSKFINNIQTK